LGSGEISTELKTFIHANITSIGQLETLLLLFEERDCKWSPDDVAAKLYIPPESSRDLLIDLTDKGLVTQVDPGLHYQYAGSEGPSHQLVQELVDAYRIRRVAVISLLFSKPVDPNNASTPAGKFRRKSR
jgi:hypothetical protein